MAVAVPPRARFYPLAVVAAALAALLRAQLTPLWGLNLPFITFYPAIMVSAWVGGFGPGITATLIGAAVAEYVWIGPNRSVYPGNAADIAALLIFVGVGCFISAVTEGLHRARRRQATAFAAEEAVRAERSRAAELFHLAVEAAPTAMVIVDREGTIRFVNSLAERLLGYARHEIVGQPIERLVPPRFRAVHGEEREGFFTDLRRRPMGAGRDLSVLRKDGAEVAVEIGLSPFDTSGGVLVLAALIDITERKRAEAEREAARAEAEAANRAKDDFLAMLSHELRTPLTAILGWARILRLGAIAPDRIASAVESIERNAAIQARLVDDLLDVSRIIAGKLQVERVPVDLLRAVESAVDIARGAAAQRSITIDTELHPMAGTVVGDFVRLQQVVVNLVSNAVKFSAEGEWVSVRLEQAGPRARLIVADRGEGIERDEVPLIFERFYQAGSRGASGTARRHGGLGLGLAIVKHIVELHGGTVRAESAGTGRGATFTVDLPIVVTPADDAR